MISEQSVTKKLDQYNSDGNVGGNTANWASRCAPACTIA